MSNITLQHLHSSLVVDDPDLPQKIVQLSWQEDETDEVLREQAPTFEKFLIEASSPEFFQKTEDEKMLFRQQSWAALERDDAEIPLSDKLRLHEILLALWKRNDGYARHCLLALIPNIKLDYGPWRGLKKIFKEAEIQDDMEIYSALAVRFDMALGGASSIKKATLHYLVRRAWRTLRRVGESFPALYADKASEMLAHYTEDTQWSATWIANHIFYHETQNYSRHKFTFKSRPSTLLKYRAFNDHWRRSPRPLLALLENARSEQVRRFAITALKTDFRTGLREIEATWVARLVNVPSGNIHDFVVWIFENVAKFEQDNFQQLGLHLPTLKLLASASAKAREYAIKYARIHGRDLELSLLIQYVGTNYADDVNRFALDMIQSRNPKSEVGLAGWGDLLDTKKGYTVAEKALRENFSRRELTLDWFQARLLRPDKKSFDFACQNLNHLHTVKKIEPNFFCSLINNIDYDIGAASRLIDWAMRQLEVFDLNGLPAEFLKTTIVHPMTSAKVVDWVNTGDLNATIFDTNFLKTLVFRPAWEADSWIAGLKNQKWAKNIQFDLDAAESVLAWLADIRMFTPEKLTFEWLMMLMQRSEALYHDFAVDVINRSFLPADFAEGGKSDDPPDEAEVIEDKDIAVDLGGDSFMFTGKLSKMTRGEAQSKVTAAGGVNASGVTKKLAYLVIGDEGSPFYGGRKGSKQLKGEKLMEEGADLKIISETAFLQMLAGEVREFSEDAIESGCLTLWNMIAHADKPDLPLALFAIKYFCHHHPDICLLETDRPVDPGAEIPQSFLTFERVAPLFESKHPRFRKFALELAQWEFARWSPPIEGIVSMAESQYEDVRKFVVKTLTVEESPEHKRYRLSHDLLTPQAVYSFCESRDEGARQLGMYLITKNPRLQLPEELFCLTESPDRKIRAFVVKQFWAWYRNTGTSNSWVLSNSGTHEKRKDGTQESVMTKSIPKNLPAELAGLEQFLNRVLYEVPPGRLEKNRSNGNEVKLKLRALPTRKSKLNLIETLRDIAMDDFAFAQHILPMLQQFRASRGKSESAACLVAITRLKRAHPELTQA